MHCYKAYGLAIHSEFEFKGFMVFDMEPDVVIQKGVIDNVSVECIPGSSYQILEKREVVFSIDSVGRFCVADGNSITVEPENHSDMRLIQRFLLGACMAFLLYQRDQLVLHASSVVINSIGVAFVGASGAGKSSIAAAFLSRGHNLLVDDISSVSVEKGTPYLFAGFPYIKLDNDMPDLARLRKEELLFMDFLEDKSAFQVRKIASTEKTALKCIYVIKPGEEIKIKKYDFQQSMIELVRYSIPPSLIKLDKAAHFKRCLEVVNRVPVFELKRPASLTCLPDVVRHIEAHLGRME